MPHVCAKTCSELINILQRVPYVSAERCTKLISFILIPIFLAVGPASGVPLESESVSVDGSAMEKKWNVLCVKSCSKHNFRTHSI